MGKILTIVALVVLLLAGPAAAELPDHFISTTTGVDQGLTLATGSVGASGILDAKAIGGEATIVFLRLSDDRLTVLERWPKTGAFGLDADDPRPFDMSGSAPDSAWVDPGTATKVVSTW